MRSIRCRQPSLDVAALRLRRKARTDDWRHEALARIQPEPRRLDLVARRQQAAPSVAASSVSATTTAIGWLA